MDYLFLRGIAVGFAIAAPVGPVGLLCIRRALADGRFAAWVAGLGAAVADTFYGAVAGLGLTLVSDFLMEYRTLLSLVGGLFLIGLGLHTVRLKPTLWQTPQVHMGLVRDFSSSFVLTLTNPATILAFMAVFASMGAVHVTDDRMDATLLISGVFVGSALWWLVLSALAGAVRHKFSETWLLWLNRGSGVILVLFGIGVLASLAFIPAGDTAAFALPALFE
ncbi:MAG: LysE family translocator [Caenispirillum bisanense]|nr:LysE family translocator [Caenispirillum bisanense]MCA1974288.1 LysE family translocator [Caenispirillum sp.]